MKILPRFKTCASRDINNRFNNNTSYIIAVCLILAVLPRISSIQMGVPTQKSKIEGAALKEEAEYGGFDSSDDENEPVDRSPFQIDWLDLSDYGVTEKLGISGLPGCRFDNTWRSLENDISGLKAQGVEEVFVFCTKGELNKFRVPRLLQEYVGAGLSIHHYPFPDGLIPSLANCLKMLEEIRLCVTQGRGTLVHCYGGLGRSALVAACLLLVLDAELEWKDAIERLRELKGSRAIQTVKQYNFVNDFRKLREEYEASHPDTEGRSISR